MEPIAYSVPTIQPRVCRLPAKPAARSSTYKHSIKIFFADFWCSRLFPEQHSLANLFPSSATTNVPSIARHVNDACPNCAAAAASATRAQNRLRNLV